jgi:hypothetical protein
MAGNRDSNSASRKIKKSRRKTTTDSTVTTTGGQPLMGSLTPLNLNPYVGILILSNSAPQAFLGQHDSTGNPIQTLMMIDTSPSGGYDPAQVAAAYRFFAAKYAGQNNPMITVYGFYAYYPGTTVPLLHVVRA